MQAIDVLAHASPCRVSRAEYDRLASLGFFRDERVELIRGIVVQMAPIGPSHADLVDRLMEAFVPPLRGRARVRIQQPLLACDDSEPEPDVAVFPLADYSKEHPDRAFVIVEVAESSLAHDRETKAALYPESGVPEYWILDVAARVMEVHGEPKEGRYTRVERVGRGARLAPSAFPDVAIDTDELLR